MAFPTVAGSSTSTEAANTTAHNVTLPASIAAGDLIIAWVFKDANGTYTWPSPWVELVDATVGSTVASVTVAYLIASGGETTVQVTSTVSERSNHIAIRITGWHGTTPPEASTGATGASTTPDPDSLNPAGWATEDTLWIAWYAIDSGAVSAYPLADNNIASPTTLSAAYGAVCTTASAVASLDPGTFTNSTSDNWRAGTIAVRPAAGGSSVARTAADSLTVSESIARTGTFLRSLTDSTGVSEAITRTGGFLRSLSDTAGLSDSLARTLTLGRTAADSLSVSESTARVGSFVRTAGDSVGLLETVSRAGTFVRTLADAVSSSETVEGIKVIVRTLADSLSISDNATRIGSFLRNTSDTLTASDTVARIGNLLRSAADGMTASATVTRTLTVTRTTADSIGLTDTVSRAVTAVRSVIDSLGLSESVTRAMGLVRTATDGVSFSESVIRSITQGGGALVAGIRGPLGIAMNAVSSALGLRHPPTGQGSTTTTSGHAATPEAEGIASTPDSDGTANT